MAKRYGRQTGQGRQMGMSGSMSERDMLQDMLLTEKYLSEMLNHAILESSNAQTRQIFQSMQTNAQDHAQMIYDEMSDQGWYNVQGASGQWNQQQSGRYRMGNQQMQTYGYSRPRSGSNRSWHSQENMQGSIPQHTY